MKNHDESVVQIKGLIEEGEAFRQLSAEPRRRHFDVIVIGGGQAGLSVGYYLKKLGLNFVILDASARIGDAWRKRWDSLRLFTPARYNGLDGMPPGEVLHECLAHRFKATVDVPPSLREPFGTIADCCRAGIL